MIPEAISATVSILDRRLDPCSEAPVTVGFSGGSDSLALLLCARAWATRHRRPLLALTVDHRLQPESGGWTRAAGETARALGVAWRALAWCGPKPFTGLQAAARRARHALLAEATRAAGGRVLILGHTGDDIAESELIRLEIPSHGRMVEWAPSPAWPQGRGVFLLRPLLALRRRELRAWLADQGLAWLEDPANTDPASARGRARATLAARLSPPSSLAAHSLSSCDDLPGPGFAGAASLQACGTLELDPPWAHDPCAIDPLGRALVCISGAERPPRRAQLERVLARIEAGPDFTATLSGARIEWGPHRLRLSRELGRRRASAMPLLAGEGVVFDGRFELTTHMVGWRVAALGADRARLTETDRRALRAIPAVARAALPVLLGPDGQAALPAPFGGGPAEARRLIGPRLAAAWGLIPDERRLNALSTAQDAGSAACALILSSASMGGSLRQATAADRSAAVWTHLRA